MLGISGPFSEDDGGSIILTYHSHSRLVPISPSLANPDETQSWIVVDYRDSWFTWIPVRLLVTLESSKDQIRKLFSFMVGCPVTSRVAKLEHGATDDLATYIHSKAHKVIERNDRPAAFRIKLALVRVTHGSPQTSDDDLRTVDELVNHLRDGDYALLPATKEFLESKLLGFEIDNNGKCSICLEDYQVNKCGGLLAKIPCQHVFHAACITNWFNTSGSCPVCRFQTERKTHRLIRRVLEAYDISDWFEAQGKVFHIQD